MEESRFYKIRKVLKDHKAAVTASKYSRDGRFFATTCKYRLDRPGLGSDLGVELTFHSKNDIQKIDH